MPLPSQPFIDQLAQATRDTSPERLRVALGENAPELATLMPALRQRYDDIADPPSLPPEQERHYLLNGVRQFLGRVTTGRPVVLLFEDLHWADESTLLLLEHLAGRLAEMPLLVIGTYRPADLASRPFTRSLTNLSRGRQAVEITLRTLTDEDVAVMLTNRAGMAPPRELVQLVLSETDGNPFFVEEVFSHLREAGKLFDADGRWRDGIAIGETEVPRGVQRVISRRLDQLGPTTRRVLSIAAVIGRTFSFDVLSSVSGCSEDELFDALEEVAPLRMIAEAPDTRDATYTFVHELLRQALLGDLSLPRRQRLHVRVADALEDDERRTHQSQRIQIANHLDLSGAAAPAERTVAALRAAGTVALDSYAFGEAMRSFDRALSYAEEDQLTQRVEIMALQAKALRGSGLMEEALSRLERALAEVPEMGPERAVLLLQRAQLLLDLFRASETLQDLSAVLDHHRTKGDRARELEVVLTLARARYVMSLDDRNFAPLARDSSEAAYRLAHELGDSRAVVRALLPTPWFMDYWPDYRSIAVANMEEATLLAVQVGDPDLTIEVRIAALRILGWSAPDSEVESLLETLEARRDPVRLKEHCFWMMWHTLWRSHLERCVEICDRGIELAAQLGSPPVQYGSIKAMALVELGRFDLVDAAIAQEVSDTGHPFGRAVAGLARVVYLDRIHAPEQASELALETLGNAAALMRVWLQQWMVSVLTSLRASAVRAGEAVPPGVVEAIAATSVQPLEVARVHWLLATGETDAAHAAIVAEISRLERFGQPARILPAEMLLVECHLDAGRTDDAEAVARNALGRAATLHQHSLTWKIRFLLARTLDAQGRGTEAEEQIALGTADVVMLAGRIDDAALRVGFIQRACPPVLRS